MWFHQHDTFFRVRKRPCTTLAAVSFPYCRSACHTCIYSPSRPWPALLSRRRRFACAAATLFCAMSSTCVHQLALMVNERSSRVALTSSISTALTIRVYDITALHHRESRAPYFSRGRCVVISFTRHCGSGCCFTGPILLALMIRRRRVRNILNRAYVEHTFVIVPLSRLSHAVSHLFHFDLALPRRCEVDAPHCSASTVAASRLARTSLA